MLALPLDFTQFQLSLQPNHSIKTLTLILKYLNKVVTCQLNLVTDTPLFVKSSFLLASEDRSDVTQGRKRCKAYL